jgi:hypothetical protein
MMKTILVLATCMLFLASFAKGGDGATTLLMKNADMPELRFTGNLHVDLFGESEMTDKPLVRDMQEISDRTQSHKSPWLAATFSLLVPGTGEFYAESYVKAVTFFAVEAAALTIAYIFDKKGDRKTDSFQNYANEHWSVVDYAQYAQDNLAPTGQTYNWRISGTQGRRPWDQVNWAELNRMERDISLTAQGSYYSHTLPPYNDQQYYELIGKYPQFNQGWDDRPATFRYGDPLTTRFEFYSGERGKANDYYSTASTSITIAVVNHILSSIDAAWSASSFNKVHAEVGMRQIPTGDVLVNIPVVKMSYSF